jgi:hypothetical protein
VTALVVVLLALLFIAWKVVKIGLVVFIVGALVCGWVVAAVAMGIVRLGLPRAAR